VQQSAEANPYLGRRGIRLDSGVERAPYLKQAPPDTGVLF